MVEFEMRDDAARKKDMSKNGGGLGVNGKIEKVFAILSSLLCITLMNRLSCSTKDTY